MQTECSAEPSVFGQVEGRPVVAAFDSGALTSDAGGLLLGAAPLFVSGTGSAQARNSGSTWKTPMTSASPSKGRGRK